MARASASTSSEDESTGTRAKRMCRWRRTETQQVVDFAETGPGSRPLRTRAVGRKTPGQGFEPEEDGRARSLRSLRTLRLPGYKSLRIRLRRTAHSSLPLLVRVVRRRTPGQGFEHRETVRACGLITFGRSGLRLASSNPMTSFLDARFARRYRSSLTECVEKRQDRDLNPESRKGTRFPGVRLAIRPSWPAGECSAVRRLRTFVLVGGMIVKSRQQ